MCTEVYYIFTNTAPVKLQDNILNLAEIFAEIHIVTALLE